MLNLLQVAITQANLLEMNEKNVIIVFTVPAFLLQLLNFCQGPGTPDKPKRDPQLTNIWATRLVQLKASEMPYM